MEEDIKVLKQLKGRWRDIGFGDKMCVCSCREQQAIVNVLNELERLKTENSNITRELLSRTNKLNDSVPKQKIRNKIKEIELSLKKDCLALHEFQRLAKIDVLREILGEDK